MDMNNLPEHIKNDHKSNHIQRTPFKKFNNTEVHTAKTLGNKAITEIPHRYPNQYEEYEDITSINTSFAVATIIENQILPKCLPAKQKKKKAPP